MHKFLEAFSVTSRRPFYPLCNIATWISNVATSILSVSVTSRRRFLYSLERRDVSNQRHDVNFYESLGCRDVDTQVATLFNPTLCNVATLASALSVTSRRCPERRDVALF